MTTAAEFVEATYSNEGIRGVYTYEARLSEMIGARPFQLPKINLVNNFSIEPYDVHVHRSWKVGSGKFFPFPKTDRPDKMSSIVCSDTPRNKTVLFATAQAKKKQRDLSKQYIDNHKNVYVSRLFDCYEEGYVKKFLNAGNLVNYLVAGKYQCIPERVPLRDTVMQIYASKLERISQKELVSVVLQPTAVTANRKSMMSHLTEGWALPKIRKVTRLTPKQIEYLTNKFNDRIKNNTRWKPEAVPAEMEYLKENGIFVFAENELLKASQIRSYFSRLKSNRQKEFKVDICTDDDAEAFKKEQAIDEAAQRQRLQGKIHNYDQLQRATSSKRSASPTEIPTKKYSFVLRKHRNFFK